MTEMPRGDDVPPESGAPLSPGRAVGVADLPSSFAQEQLWFIDEFHNGLAAHNVPNLVWLRGRLDVAALGRAVDGLVARHETLRTRLLAAADGRPVQVIDPPAPVRLEVADYAELGREAASERLGEFARQEALRPFHLAKDWPLRASLVRLAADEHALVVVAHQTALDDWSFGVLLRDLAALYRAEAGSALSGLADPLVRFADYAVWERENLQGPVLAELEDYWRGALAGFETSQFPADRQRPVLASHDGAVGITSTDRELLDGLRELSLREGTTLAVTLLAALQVLLSRYTGQTDVVVGAISADRGRPELASVVGFLASTLPVRCDLSGDPAFGELLGRVRAAAEGARAHQDLPFARVVEALHVERDPGRFPVFQVGFAWTEPADDVESAGVVFHREHVALPASRYDISFAVEPRGDGLRIECTYTPALFDAGTVRRLLGNLEVLLAGVVADPSARLSQLPVLSRAELDRELAEWNDTAAVFPAVCIHEGFEARVAATPDAVAAVFEGECWSYAELNGRANQVARRLRAAGVGPEVLVGVCMRAGLARLAGLLGVWKAGGGYVPLDPGLPAERLAFMMADTGMSAVLADEPSAASLPGGGGVPGDGRMPGGGVPGAGGVLVVSVDGERAAIGGLDATDLADVGVTPSNVAYVIYTSGSTGEPKGVVVEHRQAINFLQGMAGPWRIGPSSVVLGFAAFTFDVSVMDMFMPLLAGGRVVLAAPQTLHSPPRLAALIRDAGVTFACLPPAVLSVLTGQELAGLRTLLSAGEELSSDLLRAWLRPGLEIYNGYGPTEASIGATFMRLDAGTQLPPPIGRPKPNYQVYVLDGFLNPVPAGVVGELHIGGAGVARGYLNRPELTGQKFITDPFSSAPGGRLYKTGDLVRRRPDGTIVFIGRIDSQVKIRGLRVELGEIETALVAHPAVAQAVVTMVTDSAGQKQLAAYFRPEAATGPDAEPGTGPDAEPATGPDLADLRSHLARTLPGYMVPGHLVMLKELPLTANGKIDKAALPAPEVFKADERVPPRTLIETVLVDLYATVLGHEQVGAADSFFDVGGNSLQAMQLIAQLRDALAVDLDIAAVFLAPAPQQLAALLRDKHGFDDAELDDAELDDAEFGAELDDAELDADGIGGPEELMGGQEAGTVPAPADSQRPELTARLRRGRESGAGEIPRRPAGLTDLPMSYGQEQLWFIDQLAPGQPTYNIPLALRLSGLLDAGAAGRAIDALVARHEALRTRLPASADGRPVQVIDPPKPSPLELVDLSGLEPGKRQAALREFIDIEALRPFVLADGPLLRTWLLRLAGEEHVLLVVVHHAVFDGWSAGVLVAELAALYAAEVTGEPSGLADLPVQFADYALWERDRLQGSVLEQLEEYWRGVMEGSETVQFPTDRPRPVLEPFEGGLAVHMTDRELLDGLRDVARREGTTLFVTLMAGVLALLQRYTGQGDLVVGTASANRGRGELAPLIGFLVNTLPVRADVSGDPVFTELLARVRETTIGAYAHQDLPFGKLVETLQVERDPGRAPVFQIAMTYAERDFTPVSAAGVEFVISDLVVGIRAAKFDLDILAEARGDGLWLECSYKSALFDAATVGRLLENLEVLLRGVVADPSARLSQLPVLTQDELRRELSEWNDTAAVFPPACIHQGFEAQAARTPDGIAAEFEDEHVCYAELNRQANQIARRLCILGVGPETLVGVCMRTGLRRLAALLGVWKAGGGYVPLDPALPAERLAFMMTDAGMSVVLADDSTLTRLPETDVALLSLDSDWPAISELPGTDVAGTAVGPANVAYVIYTSGSTGQPKGVVVEHRQAVNSLQGMIERWQIGPSSVVLQFAAFSFDVSVMDMFMALLAGARLVLASVQTLHSPPRLAALMRQAGVTYADLPPAVLSLLRDEQFADLRVLLAGGEELPAELARRWARPGLRFVNAYGPTEATVTATCQELDGSVSPLPIGRPLPNYQAYVLDAYLSPVPAGVTGELHIGGASVARGYLGRPELTAERFIGDPFRPGAGARLYKTGDLVRRRPDGVIVFVGRADDQVKVRGLRIELGEIEAALVAHLAVAQAVVTVVTDPAGDRQLAAYLRPEPGAGPDAGPGAEADLAGLRAHLARMLPAYMVPVHLITVAALPLNTSGKIDKAALPAPDYARAVTEHAAPATVTETILVALYAAVLGREQVGVADSFFDIGGSSLQVMRLVGLISKELGVDVGVSTIFLHPSPRQLAASIEAVRSGAAELAGPGPVVRLSSGIGEPPLFLIHPVGGTVFAYAQLASELAGTFTVYGLEAPGLSQPDATAESLAGLVDDYTQRIRAVQTAGPYRLAGWSMGGVIAFEIARRLEQDGEQVVSLMLLDAPFSVPDTGVPDTGVPGQAELAGRFLADAAHSLGWDTVALPDPATASAAEQLAWLAGRLGAGHDGDDGHDGHDTGSADRDAVATQLRRRFDVFQAHIRMLAGYQPTAPEVRAPALIVSADDSPNAPARSRWPRVLGGPVTTERVDGDHYSFLRPPLVAEVGTSILKWHDDWQ